MLKGLATPQRPDGPQGPIGFTISADLPDPRRDLCAAAPEAAGQLFEDRPPETVGCTEVEFTPGAWPRDAWPLRSLALRFRKTPGQLFPQGHATQVPGGGDRPRGGRG